MVLIPLWGEAATSSWPPWRRMATVFEPIRPVPPMTTIFMFYPPLSTIGGHTQCRMRQRSASGSNACGRLSFGHKRSVLPGARYPTKDVAVDSHMADGRERQVSGHQ